MRADSAKIAAPAPPTAISASSQGGPAWLGCWYDVIRSLPSCADLDTKIVLAPPPDETAEFIICGLWSGIRNTIYVAQMANPYETIATLIHEVAHVLSNHRHRRAHGYSWRRAFAAVMLDLTGENVLPVADEIRRRWRHEGRQLSRQTAMDLAAVLILTQGRVQLYAFAAQRRVLALVCGHSHEASWVTSALQAPMPDPEGEIPPT